MYLDSAYCALPPSMAFGWYGVCVTWISCFLIARLFKSISTHFLCLFARSSQVRVNTNDRQQSNVKAFYNTSHLDLTINHPRATNYPERLIKIHFTDIICDWTVGGPRKSSELARRLKSYWPLHLDLTLAGRSEWARSSRDNHRSSPPSQRLSCFLVDNFEVQIVTFITFIIHNVSSLRQ